MKNEPQIIGELLISLYDDGDVELSYSSNLELNTRIAMLKSTLAEQISVLTSMLEQDSEGHLRS